jgi:hypothetical protein
MDQLDTPKPLILNINKIDQKVSNLKRSLRISGRGLVKLF